MGPRRPPFARYLNLIYNPAQPYRASFVMDETAGHLKYPTMVQAMTIVHEALRLAVGTICEARVRLAMLAAARLVGEVR